MSTFEHRPTMFCSVLVCCLFVMVTSEYTNNGILRIPLMRLETGFEKLLRQGADLKLIGDLYNMARQGYGTMKNGKPIPQNDTLPLYKYFDTEYYALVNIGKPGKTFKMILDTAWGLSWVPSSACPLTRLPCALHNRYDHSGSSTNIPDGRPLNITGRYIGNMTTDTFTVGQLKAQNQSFAELTQLPWIYSLYESDGIIGLGLENLTPGTTPFFYKFYQQNKLSPVFSFYVNRDPTTKRGGAVFFGGIDTKHNKSAFTTVNLNSDVYWQFKMDKVSLVLSKEKSVLFCKNGCNATADTSSNTIIGPSDEIKQINTMIGATDQILFTDRYMIPCNNEFKAPKMKFTIANQEFQIWPRDYIQKLSYSGLTLCLSAFQPAGPNFPPNTWTLGGAFLYQFYTAFDVEKRTLSIAEAA